jgi:hypothetical protein
MGESTDATKSMSGVKRRMLFTSSICNVGWLWIKPMDLSGSLTTKKSFFFHRKV